ncbi:hypothetical protein B0A55_08228 [Friedmanniomyces simplex]|uniref:Uncharacterized protein n=1 Tax=Friedmanniomyces simplex TaxID=329884 RepID=A0A4U0X495_9PEZI|nr:hypothetical protein B0A55_08228 [Friedmanniomyces simplex]
MDTHVVLPTTTHTHTIVLLHGRDSTTAEFAPEFFESQATDGRTLPETFPGIKWAFPTASLIRSARFGTEMSQWFDMHSTEDPHEESQHDDDQKHQLSEAAASITKIVNEEAQIIGSDHSSFDGAYQGVRTPILLSHAQDDEVINIKYGRELRDELTRMGYQVEWREYEDGGHWVNEPRGVDDIVAFVRRHSSL